MYSFYDKRSEKRWKDNEATDPVIKPSLMEKKLCVISLVRYLIKVVVVIGR